MPSTRQRSEKNIKPLYESKWGRMYHGRAEDVLVAHPVNRYRGRIQLVFTSPPFPLNRKKRYGNLRGDEYVAWIASFAPMLRDYLTEDGSIVIELGNAWEPGDPTMSTLPMRALLAFQEEANLKLCQEFICFNTARLPTPAQWVNIERIRVKDAFTRVWWMSPTPRPKADNRQVLTQYSDSMRTLLRKGTYNPGRRPSEHQIGATSFIADHGGAIPPNVLVPAMESMLPDIHEVLPIANTRSNDSYQAYCRENSVVPHPARMPMELVRFFTLLLTDEGDRVLDPFAGSNTTGFVAEGLRRRWLAVEANGDYARASASRFGLAPH